MPDDRRKQLYDALSKNNFDVGSFEDFNTRMNDSTSRRKLYDVASANNFELGDYPSFEDKVTGGEFDRQAEEMRSREQQAQLPYKTGSGVPTSASPAQQILQSGDIKPDIMEAQSSNVPTKLAGFGKAVIKSVSSPFTVGQAVNESFAGAVGGDSFVGSAIRSPFALMGKASEGISSALEWNAARMHLTPEMRKSLIQKYLGADPQQADYINQAGTEAVNLGAQVLTAEALPSLIKGTGEITAPARARVGSSLIESAYKIPTTIKTARRAGIVETIAKHGAPLGKSSYEKFTSTIADIKGHAEDLEKNANLPKQVINTKDITGGIDELKQKWQDADTPKEFIEALDKYKAKILSQHGETVNGQELLNMKRLLQEQLAPVFAKQMKINPGFKTTLVDQAKHTVEVAAKKQLEQMIPGYAADNAEIHKMLTADPYIQRATNRIGNWNVVRLTDMILGGIGGGAGFLSAGSEGGAVGAMTATVVGRLLASPKIHAWLGKTISPIEPFKMPSGMPPAPVIRPMLPAARPGTVEDPGMTTLTGSNYDLGVEVHAGLRRVGFESSEAQALANKAASGVPLSRAEAEYIGLHSPQVLELFRQNGLLAYRGMLPETGTHDLTNPMIADATGSRPAFQTGALEQTVPESRIRGTGREGLDINSWQNQTSAVPTVTNYALPDYTGYGSTPPESALPPAPEPTQPSPFQPPPGGNPRPNEPLTPWRGGTPEGTGTPPPTPTPSGTPPPATQTPAVSAVDKYLGQAKTMAERTGRSGKFEALEPAPDNPTSTNEMVNAGSKATYDEAKAKLTAYHDKTPLSNRYRGMTKEEKAQMTPEEKAQVTKDITGEQPNREFAEGYVAKHLDINHHSMQGLTREEQFQVLDEAHQRELAGKTASAPPAKQKLVSAPKPPQAPIARPPSRPVISESKMTAQEARDISVMNDIKYRLNRSYGFSYDYMKGMTKEALINLENKQFPKY